MAYLLPSEYVAYGLDAATADSLVAAASSMIEAFCRRPSLLPMTYVERLRVARDGQTVRLTNAPLIAITASRVRLRRVRPGMPLSPLQQIAGVFGLAGTWSTIDPSQLITYANGEVEIPVSLLGIGFDEAEISYTAGYATVPDAVKSACAQIVKNAEATPALNVKRQQVDALEMEYFSGALLDAEVQRVLRPYISVRLG